MNRGTPPTAPNARTGEFTPPGVTSRARANSDSLRAGHARVSHGASQASTMYSSSRSASGSGCSCGGRSQREARPGA